MTRQCDYAAKNLHSIPNFHRTLSKGFAVHQCAKAQRFENHWSRQLWGHSQQGQVIDGTWHLHLSLWWSWQPPWPLHQLAQAKVLHPGHFMTTYPCLINMAFLFSRSGEYWSVTLCCNKWFAHKHTYCKFHVCLPFNIYSTSYQFSPLFVSAAIALVQVFIILSLNNLLTN